MLYQYLLLIFSTHLDLPETDVQSGQITENQTSVLPVRWKNVIVGIVGILFALFLIWFVLWITREPDERETWERRKRILLKKYGSQLFEVEEMPDTTGKSVIRLQSIESLLQISEDKNAPVLYVL